MITGGMIKRMVADEFGVSVTELEGACRSRRLSRPRAVAMWIIHHALGYSSGQIGRLMRRERTSVVHAQTMIADLRSGDAALAARMDRLLEACRPRAADISAEQIPDVAARLADALVDEFRTAARRAALRDPQRFMAQALSMLTERETPCAS